MIDYVLGLATRRTAAEVAVVVEEVLGVPSGMEWFTRGALGGTVSAIDSPVFAEVWEEILGTSVTSELYCLVNYKSDDHEAVSRAEEDLAVVSALVAIRCDAEACLAHSGETVMMRRTAGELVLYDRFPVWARVVAAGRIPAPFRVSSAHEAY